MESTRNTGEMVVVSLSQLQQIRDSLEMAESRLASLPAFYTSDSTKTPTAVHISHTELKTSLAGIKKLTGTQSITNEASAAVSQVFGTQELLEMIFDNLHPLDLLRATQTCRATAALLNSKRVRTAMCAVPVDASDEILPFHGRDDVCLSTFYDMLRNSTLNATFTKMSTRQEHVVLPRLDIERVLF